MQDRCISTYTNRPKIRVFGQPGNNSPIAISSGVLLFGEARSVAQRGRKATGGAAVLYFRAIAIGRAISSGELPR